MTEQEVEIKRVISYIRSCREAGIDTTITIDKSRSHFILNALEEIQQYQALGTVMEIKTREASSAHLSEEYLDNLGVLREYQSLGTVEELREAIKHWNRRLFPTSQVRKNRLPSDDLLSRKLVYADNIAEYIKTEINPYGKPFQGSAYELGLKIVEYVENCGQAIDLEFGEWIPCSEKLPENDTEVLITARSKIDGELEIAISSWVEALFGGKRLGFKAWSKPWEYFHSNYDVIAWQPLPEPYRVTRDNSNQPSKKNVTDDK